MISLRPADSADVAVLVAMMSDFYSESGYPLDIERAALAFRELVDDARLGRVWIIDVDGQPSGYVVLTLGFSMEYGGRDAFIDDLYVAPGARGRGAGTRALAEVRRACESLGVRALHLEVGAENDAAQRVYRRAGFKSQDRVLMTLILERQGRQNAEIQNSEYRAAEF